MQTAFLILQLQTCSTDASALCLIDTQATNAPFTYFKAILPAREESKKDHLLTRTKRKLQHLLLEGSFALFHMVKGSVQLHQVSLMALLIQLPKLITQTHPES